MKHLIFTLLTILSHQALAASPDNSRIKIGALAFGTLNWELAVIRNEGLDKAHGVTLEETPLASAEAGKIALQGKSVDMIVGDWIWVARQRQQGMDFTFAPYSTSHGALMVPQGSNIHGVADLAGKRLGVAGGGLDKNWLLLRALAQKTAHLDLDQKAQKTFGAPPLLNQELQQGKLDAVLNYWNYAAKLEAQGYRKVLDGRQILKGLGIDADVPALGYVFRGSWAQANPAAIEGFLKAAAEARTRICESGAVWAKVAPLTQESDTKVQDVLRQHYCAGRITPFGATELKAAEQIFDLVNNSGEQPAKDQSAPLPAGTFWLPGSR